MVGFCRAVEIELNERLVRPFGSYVAKLASHEELQADLQGGRKAALLRAIPRGASAGLDVTLGDLARALDYARASRERLYRLFREYVEAHCLDQEFWLSHDQAPAILTSLARDFRNKAAHTGVVTPQMLDDLRERILGIKSQPGCLARIVQAASPLSG